MNSQESEMMTKVMEELNARLEKLNNQAEQMQSCNLDMGFKIQKMKTEETKIEENYKKAKRAYYIAAFLWGLCIIVQILANLDRILPFGG